MKTLNNFRYILIALVLVVVAGYWFIFRNQSPFAKTAEMSEYSAVALNSNELFFGRISSQTETEMVLEDVYFFTFVQDPAASPVANTTQTNENLQPTLIDTNANSSLAPTSVYVINKDQIKYSYPLKKDTQVVKTIDDYKKANP